MLELAERVRKLTGSSSEIVHEPLPVDDPVRRRPDISRAIERLGWTPKIELDQGLAHTIADFRARIGQPGVAPTNGDVGTRRGDRAR